MAGKPKKKETLSRERIVATALALVDEEGLDALSMRRLGAELGVDPMAVYYHIPNKAALEDAVVEAVMAQIDLSVDDPSLAPEERVVRAGTAYATAMFAHANTIPLMMSRGPVTPAGLAPVELLVGIFRDAGKTAELAVIGMNVVAAMVRGYVAMVAPAMAEQDPQEGQRLAELISPDTFPRLAEAFQEPPTDPRKMFEVGLRATAMGLLGSE